MISWSAVAMINKAARPDIQRPTSLVVASSSVAMLIITSQMDKLERETGDAISDCFSFKKKHQSLVSRRRSSMFETCLALSSLRTDLRRNLTSSNHSPSTDRTVPVVPFFPLFWREIMIKEGVHPITGLVFVPVAGNLQKSQTYLLFSK
jgi:hypothetical protein